MNYKSLYVLEMDKVNVNFAVSLSFKKGNSEIALKEIIFEEKSISEGICTYEYKDENIILNRYIKLCDERRVTTWLTLKNISDVDIFLTSISVLDSAHINIHDTDSSEWMFLRNGRHKNDLPSTCILGKKDDNFSDAVMGLLESGKREDGIIQTNKLISDQLTILKHPNHNAGLLLGFDTGINQMVETIVTIDESGKLLSLQANCIFNIVLAANSYVETEKLRVEIMEDDRKSIQNYALEKAKLYRARKAKTPPSVFCTWYYYGLSVTQDDVYENLNELINKKIPFDVFQIDEGWEITLGDWRSNKKFPSGMKKLAEDIVKAGYRPGIWTSPFIAHESAPITKEHPEWFLYHENGEICLFPMNDTVYYVLDITNAEVLVWVEELYRMISKEWGYTYHKLDFTRAPVIQENTIYHNKNITLTEAYRNAIEAVRRGIGDESYLLMCGGLYDPIIGLVDAQRTSSDVLSMWEDSVGKGGKAVPFTVKQNCYRYFMNDWWDNDPDALMVRRQKEMTRGLNLTYGLLNDEEAKTVTLNQYVGGGIVCSTEPMKTIDMDRLMLLRHILPVVNTKPTAVDLFSGERYISIIDVDVKENSYHTVALINWSDTEKQNFTLRLDEKLLGNYINTKDNYVVSTFYSKLFVDNLHYGDNIEITDICHHGCEIVKIQAKKENTPIVIYSDGHFSMGAELEKLEVKNDILFFEMHNKFECTLNYSILLPNNRYPEVVYDTMEFKDNLLHIQIVGAGIFKYEIMLSH